MGATSDDGDTCAVCLERVCSVAAEGKFLFHTFNIWILFSFCGIFWFTFWDDFHAHYFVFSDWADIAEKNFFLKKYFEMFKFWWLE